MTKCRLATVLVAGLPMFYTGAGVPMAGALPKPAPAAMPLANTTSEWRADKALLGEAVYSDTGERIGTVGAVVITAGRMVSHLVIGVGEYVGTGRHDVAIPVAAVIERRNGLVLPGVTKASLRAMPAFAYAPDNAVNKP